MSYNCVDKKTTNTLFQHKKQNQPFADVLQNEFYEKFPKIHKKTPMPESFFQKNCMHSGSFFITIEIPAQFFSCEFCEFLGTHFLRKISMRLKKNPKSFTLLLFVTYEFCSSESTKHFVIKE